MSGTLAVRPMRADDTPRMHELHTACLRQLCVKDYSQAQVAGWLASRTPEGYLNMVETHGERMLVATFDGIVVGFASWKDIELCSLYVDPDHNGRGIGRALHQACEDDARAMGRRIIRVDSTLTGRGFYERLGYRLTRRTSHRNGSVRIPALVMHRRNVPTRSD